MAMIPAGFRFMPTDHELLSYLLHHKEINGLEIPFICEKQIYGDEATPWDVFDDSETYWIDCGDSGKKNKKMIHVFSKPCKVGNSISNKRINRVAGCGTWEGKSSTLDLKDSEGRVIGKKRQFSFKPKKEYREAKGKGHWIMHELSLIDGYKYVLCRITKELSKEETSLPAIIDDHQERIGEEEGQDQGRKRKTLGEEEEEDGNMMNPMKKACCDEDDHDQRSQEEFLATLFPDESFQASPHLNPLSFSTMYQQYQDCILG